MLRTRAKRGNEAWRGAWRGAGLFVAGMACLAAALFFVYRARHAPVVNEDAFISFRYARNLIAGEGLVFNPGGERVEGITNLLWTLLLAAGSWASGVSLPEVASFLGVLCGALTVCVVFLWCRAEVSEVSSSRLTAVLGALAAPLLLSLAPGFAFYASTGLEVAPFALLLTGGLYLLSRTRTPGTLACGSVALGLAAITRPEGVLALGIAACALAAGRTASLGKRFRRLLLAGAPGVVVVGAFTLWRLYYYGSVVPNTAHAKAGGVEVVERWGLPYLMDAAQGNWFLVAWLVALGGAALDRGLLLRGLAVLAITPLWCAYVVYVGGDYMAFHRLLVPLLPALFVLAVAGFARVPASMPGSPVRVAVSGLLALALAFPLLAGLPDQFRAEEETQASWQRDNERRHEVARWFQENDPNALVARNGVGVLGYHSEIEIIDMLGLNDGHIARDGNEHPEALPGHQSSDAEYVLSREPDYIMVNDLEPGFRFPGDGDLVNSPKLREEYDLVRVELDTGREIRMFRRA